MSSILLKGGTLLVHDAEGRVQPQEADILIRGSEILKIQKDIDSSEYSAKLIDCVGKIVSPGFISTHHHLWQTQFKGKHCNQTLLEYLPQGNSGGAFYTIEDGFWGQLAGSMEAMDAGTTTVLDHSSLNFGPEYPPTLIQAIATSGLRSVYCQTVPRHSPSRSPFCIADNYEPKAALETWKSLASLGPLSNRRIQMGFAIDNLYLPPSQLQEIYSELRAFKAKVITTHSAADPSFKHAPSNIRLLNNGGLLGPDILLSHGQVPDQDDLKLISEHGVTFSTTPNTELQMGSPLLALRPELEPHCSLGVDCHSWGTSFIPGQMRLLLQHARTALSDKLAANDNWSRHVGPSVEQVFNLGTLGGARAIGMAGEVGQIKVGAKADLVIFSTTTPAMLAAAVEDPVGAIVLHSSERDIEMVIADGVIRKSEGKLLPVSVAPPVGYGKGVGIEGKSLTWNDVAGNVLESRVRINERSAGIDWKAAEEAIIDAFYLDRASMIEQGE